MLNSNVMISRVNFKIDSSAKLLTHMLKLSTVAQLQLSKERQEEHPLLLGSWSALVPATDTNNHVGKFYKIIGTRFLILLCSGSFHLTS